MKFILPFLLIVIAVSSIISIPTLNQRNSFSRKGRSQDGLYYSPHLSGVQNCQKQTNVIPLNLLSHKKDGLITIVIPGLTQNYPNEQNKDCRNPQKTQTFDRQSKTAGYQFIKNGNFQADRLSENRLNQTFARSWIFNQSYIVQGPKLFPKWTTQVALIGIQCLSQLQTSSQNRPFSVIQQSFELQQPTKIAIGFNYGLITVQVAFRKMPIEKTRLLWVHFNGQLIFSSEVTQIISNANLTTNGRKGKNILTFKSIRADFDCISSQMIALDNITATKI